MKERLCDVEVNINYRKNVFDFFFFGSGREERKRGDGRKQESNFPLNKRFRI